MWSMIESLPLQYRWAATLDTPAIPPSSTILVCGMGGSGISGDFVQAAVAETQVDVRIHKDYGLPKWAASARPLVIAVSYSGNTAETLSSLGEAIDLELPVAVISTGGEAIAIADNRDLPRLVVPSGLQPRAALGYLVGAVLRLVGRSTGLSETQTMLAEAADLMEEMLADEETRNLAREIAANLSGRLPVIWARADLRKWPRSVGQSKCTRTQRHLPTGRPFPNSTTTNWSAGLRPIMMLENLRASSCCGTRANGLRSLIASR